MQAEMAESEAIWKVVMQVAIQAALAAVIVMREADAHSPSHTNVVSSGEVCRHRNGRPPLRKPSFNWYATIGTLNYLVLRWKLHTSD